MILDSSAIVAIIMDEPERQAFAEAIRSADLVAVGAPTLVEAAMVLIGRTGVASTDAITDVIGASDVAVIEFGSAHWQTAIQAWITYGRGRHPARLNLGDCLAYATAKVARQPLLAKGDDFAKTDIELVPLGTHRR